MSEEIQEKMTIKVQDREYVVGQDMACLIHSLLVLMDPVLKKISLEQQQNVDCKVDCKTEVQEV